MTAKRARQDALREAAGALQLPIDVDAPFTLPEPVEPVVAVECVEDAAEFTSRPIEDVQLPGMPSDPVGKPDMPQISDGPIENDPYRDAPDVWSAAVAPGGLVCSVCGSPTESEPCAEHQPDAYAEALAEAEPLVWDRTEHRPDAHAEAIRDGLPACDDCFGDVGAHDPDCPQLSDAERARNEALADAEPDPHLTVTPYPCPHGCGYYLSAYGRDGHIRDFHRPHGPNIIPWRTWRGPDEPPVIDRPGIWGNLTPEEYHADPVPGGSLSSSGAKLIRESLARYRWVKDHPAEHKPVWDLGRGAHRYALSAGADVVEIRFDNWRRQAARNQRDEAYEAGLIPLLSKDCDVVRAMAAALLEHPRAARLFAPGAGGRAEQALFWRDPVTGVVCRCLLDWLPASPPPGERMIIPEYKSARSARPDEDLQRDIWKFGYHQQAEWNARGVVALGLAAEAAVVFVFQEKEPPYLVQPVELTRTALRIGAIENMWAMRDYELAVRSGEWPGYSDTIEQLGLPAWVEKKYGED